MANSIDELVYKYASSPDVNELELICKLKLDRSDIDILVDLFGLETCETTVSLDVALGSGNRLSIDGTTDIFEACIALREDLARFVPPPSATLVKKALSTRRSVKVSRNDDSFILRLSEERAIPREDIDVAWLRNLIRKRSVSNDSLFRLKRRVSKNHGTLRMDLTAVRSSSTIEALPFEPLSYELEMEVIMTPDQGASGPDFVNRVRADVLEFTSGIQNALQERNPHQCPVTEKHRRSVVASYLALAYGRDQVTLEGALKAPKRFFLGPQPVTLERHHMKHPASLAPGETSVWQAYTVTDKADGERMLLFRDENGCDYLINNRLHVRRVGGLPSEDARGTILDGEYISTTLPYPLFVAFDVYFYGGSDKRTVEEHARRMQCFRTVDFPTSRAFLAVEPKVFYETSVPGNVAKCLDSLPSKPYVTDGLVFTPSHMAVGEMYPGGGTSRDVTWPLVYKWKPMQENTIDFLTRKNDQGSFDLCVGKSVFTDVDVYGALSGAFDVHVAAYEASMFDQDPSLPRPVYYGASRVRDKRVYEFAYDRAEHAWYPKRERKDKTELYFRQDRQIGGTANDYEVAMQIWRTLVSPVTDEDLRRDRAFDETSGMASDRRDVYYKRKLARANMATKHMMDAHNFLIKTKFVFGTLARPWRNRKTTTRLLDIGCGRSGDADRWRMAGIDHVLGIDASRDNIVGNEGAYNRMLKRWARDGFVDSNQRYVFLVGDLTRDVTDIESLMDHNDARVLRHLWGRDYDTRLGDSTYKFASARSFDIVSCQFALHYLWADLDTLVDNVDHYLRPGGLFVGTCLDGRRVVDMVNATPDKIAQASILRHPNPEYVLWRIRTENGEPAALGGKVHVYLESIGQELPEYLVDFDRLTAKLAERDIHPYRVPGTDAANGIYAFDDVLTGRYESVVDAKDECVKESSRLCPDRLLADPDLVRYSSLNACFAFVKRKTKSRFC